MAITPQTTAKEIGEALNNLIDPGLIVPVDSPQVIAILDALDQLAIVDKDRSLSMRALVVHMTGDLPGALAINDKCQGGDPINRLVILSNYSQAQESRELYREHCGPHTGYFTSTISYGIAAGAFHTIARFARDAERMHLDKVEKIGLEKIYMIDDLLSDFGISDEESGQLIETAGSILIEHGLMFLGTGPQIDVIDVPGELRTLHLTYRIATTATKAIEIYLEFIARLMNKGQTIPPGLHISFEGIA